MSPNAMRLLLSVLSLPLLGAGESPSPEASAAALITEGVLLGNDRFLSSDLLEGRAPATRGDALAEAYIASQFEVLGLKPAGTDGYLQPFELLGALGHPDVLTFSASGRTLALRVPEEAIASSGTAAEQARLDAAEVVFVGYGIQAPEFDWDDFKGMDVRGKVLLVMNNDPSDDPALFAGKTRLYYGRWTYKMEMGQRLGAAGVIIIHTDASAGYPWQVVQTSWSGEQFFLPSPNLGPSLRAWATEDACRRLVALAGKDLDALRGSAEQRSFRPVPLGVTLSTDFHSTVRKTHSANVLGVLPGTDPRRAGEYVVYTAHHDHLGVKSNAKPGEDAIYNGAVDDAGGVSQLLAVARAFASLPKRPARSILFAAVGAEEKGLLGSEYLVRHPPIPLGRMAVDINMDGFKIFGATRDVSVLGLGKTSLDKTLAALAQAQGRVLGADSFPEQGHFYRSDQFSFARAGVPALHYYSGVEAVGRPAGWGRAQQDAWVTKHYHQPSDELGADWDLAGAVQDARLYFALGYAVAQAPGLPTWVKGDEFEAAGKAIRSAVVH
jgi:Zn-dependent M28 family amino/carboxypeptidase